MLLFTNEQQAAVNGARAAFNASQTALAAQTTLMGNASPIPLDSWRRIDARSAAIQRDVLAVFNRLSAASTTPVGVADLVNFYSQVSDSGEVNFSMDGRNKAKSDQALVKYSGTPVPVYDTSWSFAWRQMAQIMKGSGSLDNDTAANGLRKLAEQLENAALNGDSRAVVNGATIYGLRTFPQRNTDTHGLTLATSTGAQWLAAMVKLVNVLIGDNAYGKITVFLNYGDYVAADMNEFIAGYPKTILQRLREIGQIVEFVPCSKLPANEIIGIANLATGDWGTILSAMPITTRPLARLNPEDEYKFSAIAMAAPQFRSDYNGQSQIAHLTAS